MGKSKKSPKKAGNDTGFSLLALNTSQRFLLINKNVEQVLRGEVFRAQAHKQGNWRQLVGHHIIVCARVVLEPVQAHIAGANIDQEIMHIFLVIGCIIAVGINECCCAQTVRSSGRSPLNDKETLAIGIGVGVVVVNIALQIGG